VVKVICHKADRRRTRMIQCYSTGDSNVSFHKGTLAPPELVHPSAHLSPQSKRRMDRYSRFCTAYGRKCLYFTMSAPIHQNCPFAWKIWTSHVKLDAFVPSPFPQIDIIGAAMVIVWRVTGKIIRSALCNIVCNNCAQCNAHTYKQT